MYHRISAAEVVATLGPPLPPRPRAPAAAWYAPTPPPAWFVPDARLAEWARSPSAGTSSAGPVSPDVVPAPLPGLIAPAGRLAPAFSPAPVSRAPASARSVFPGSAVPATPAPAKMFNGASRNQNAAKQQKSLPAANGYVRESVCIHQERSVMLKHVSLQQNLFRPPCACHPCSHPCYH